MAFAVQGPIELGAAAVAIGTGLAGVAVWLHAEDQTQLTLTYELLAISLIGVGGILMSWEAFGGLGEELGPEGAVVSIALPLLVLLVIAGWILRCRAREAPGAPQQRGTKEDPRDRENEDPKPIQKRLHKTTVAVAAMALLVFCFRSFWRRNCSRTGLPS